MDVRFLGFFLVINELKNKLLSDKKRLKMRFQSKSVNIDGSHYTTNYVLKQTIFKRRKCQILTEIVEKVRASYSGSI